MVTNYIQYRKISKSIVPRFINVNFLYTRDRVDIISLCKDIGDIGLGQNGILQEINSSIIIILRILITSAINSDFLLE